MAWVHGSNVLREVSYLEGFRVVAAMLPSVLGHCVGATATAASVASVPAVVLRLHDDAGLLEALGHCPTWVVGLVLQRPLPLAALHKMI